MEDEAMAGWLLLAMDRVSNFVRILWLSGSVAGSGLREAAPAYRFDVPLAGISFAASCEVWIEEIFTGAHGGNRGCASHSFLRHIRHFMEDEATAGWLLLAMDRVSNFVRILWLSGLVEGTDLKPQGDDTSVGRLTDCFLRGSIDDCRLLIFEWVIGCWGSPFRQINNQK